MVRTNSQKEMFGIEGYRMPDPYALFPQKRNFHIDKTKKEDAFAFLIKEKVKVPPPGAYNTEGSLIFKKKNLSIYKRPRESFVTEYVKLSRNVPGIGQYDPKIKEKIKGSYKT